MTVGVDGGHNFNKNVKTLVYGQVNSAPFIPLTFNFILTLCPAKLFSELKNP